MSDAKHLAAEEQGRSAMRDFWEKTGPARDEVAKQTRAAVDDIRIKVVEEGWTGKAQTTPAQEVRSADLYGHSQTNDQQHGVAETENPELTKDQDSQSAAQSHYGDAPERSDAADLYGPDDLGRDDSGQDAPDQDGPDMER